MRKILLSLVSFCALCALVGCGSSNNNTVPVPANPAGGNNAGFSNASLLAGTAYVFSVSGVNNNTGGSYVVVGSFISNGDGSITSGTRDTVNDSGGQSLNETLTPASSTYFVNADGRGQMVLNGPSGQVIYRFVLHAPTAQHPSQVGELFQDGQTSDRVVVDATGTIQQVSGTPATPTGTYIIGLNGEDSIRNPYGAIGGITFTGNNIAGLIDENDNGNYAQETQPLTATGTIALTSSRGTATLVTPNGINPATHNFVVYYVSPSELDLVSTDPKFFLYGNADQQTSFAPTNGLFIGDQVFSISGVDNSGPGRSIAPRVEAGRLTLNGDGTLSNAIEDYTNYNNVFAGVDLTANSSYSAGVEGRWTANLVNSTTNTTTDLVGWQVSFGAVPTQQKSFVLTTNSNILETGVMLGQTLDITDAQVSGNYAESLAGYNTGGQDYVELTGNLNADGNGNFLTGTYDAQTDDAGLILDNATSGTYNTGDATFGRSTSASVEDIPIALYTVDANTMFFVSSQQGSIYQGAIINQQ
jgi:hypothetical protein